jgi:hypothetical protein
MFYWDLIKKWCSELIESQFHRKGILPGRWEDNSGVYSLADAGRICLWVGQSKADLYGRITRHPIPYSVQAIDGLAPQYLYDLEWFVAYKLKPKFGWHRGRPDGF